MSEKLSKCPICESTDLKFDDKKISLTNIIQNSIIGMNIYGNCKGIYCCENCNSEIWEYGIGICVSKICGKLVPDNEKSLMPIPLRVLDVRYDKKTGECSVSRKKRQKSK
ncbi:MAG: hypothetical protein K2G36_01425 [Ruminococcus sp.]|nr:hypothetical protein [Ruminococcus sp.]